MTSPIRSVVHTSEAPAAIGPYSQAIRTGHFVFCSGQLPADPSTGELVQGDTAAQTRQVLKNLEAVLRAAGADLSTVVKTTIFMTDLREFAEMNQAYGAFFKEAPPARATVQVSALPKGARVEIEAVALLPAR